LCQQVQNYFYGVADTHLKYLLLLPGYLFKRKPARRGCCNMFKHTRRDVPYWSSMDLLGSLWTILTRVDTR